MNRCIIRRTQALLTKYLPIKSKYRFHNSILTIVIYCFFFADRPMKSLKIGLKQTERVQLLKPFLTCFQPINICNIPLIILSVQYFLYLHKGSTNFDLLFLYQTVEQVVYFYMTHLQPDIDIDRRFCKPRKPSLYMR